MSDPHVYPEPPNGPLLAPAAAGAPDPTFTPIEQLAGQGQAGRTMFIRVAMSGADCPGAISPTAPNFYLRADSGDPVLVNDHAPAPNQTYPIFHRPAHDLGDYIGEGSIFLEDQMCFESRSPSPTPTGATIGGLESGTTTRPLHGASSGSFLRRKKAQASHGYTLPIMASLRST
jgi:hypothetical protein